MVQFDNLTIGQDYLIQALVYDGRPVAFGRAVEFDGVDLGQFGNGDENVRWGPGILASGSFTADAVTQSFAVEIFSDTSYTTSVGTQLNAVSLHAVPEPASLTIWAGGGAWCVSGRGYAPPSDTPRGLFPNSLMSTGTKTGEGSVAVAALAAAAVGIRRRRACR